MVNWTTDDDFINTNLTTSVDDGGGNATVGEDIQTGIVNWFLHILIAFILAILILVTAIGNVFVIAVILLERHLQSVANYLILSLAAADLLVAVLVMPLGAVYQVTGKWVLGPELCDMWTSSDVLCCTASILHLVAIATDRYWAVTSIDYIQKRTFKRITIMILFVWIISALVSLCPLIGWKDPDWHQRIEEYQCLISQDVGYQVFATMSTFYVPLAIILGLYWRIFVTAKKRIRRRNKQQAASSSTGTGNNATTGHRSGGIESVRPPAPSIALTSTAGTTATMMMSSSSNNGTAVAATSAAAGISLVSAETACTIIAAAAGVLELSRISKVQHQQQLCTIEEPCCSSLPSMADETSDSNSPQQQQQQLQPIQQQQPQSKGQQPKRQQQQQSMAAVVAASVNNKRRNMESKRERKAAKTLAIITGAFVVCWLPFFVCALLMPLCSSCKFDDNMVAVFLWLGYFNSTLNPILYTIFSPEFRNAFQKLLRIKRTTSAGSSGTTSAVARNRAAGDGRPDISSVHTGLLPVSAIGTTTTTTSFGRRSSVQRNCIGRNNSGSKIEVDRHTSIVAVSVNYSAA